MQSQELTNEYPAASILHPTDKRGCQLAAEQLSLCYHYNLHGFYGKDGRGKGGVECEYGRSEDGPSDFKSALPPSSRCHDEYEKAYRITMNFRF